MPTSEPTITQRLMATEPGVQYTKGPADYAKGIDSYFERKWALNPYRVPYVHIGDEHQHIPAVLAHELGHAEFDRTRLGRVLQNPIFRHSLNSLALPASAIGGVLAARSDSGAAPYAAMALPALMHAPTLISEGAASYNALKKLRNIGASAADISKARRQLAGAFGSYLGHAGLSGLAAAAPLLAKKYWPKAQPQEQAEPSPEATKSAEDALEPMPEKGLGSYGLFRKDPSHHPVAQRMFQGALAGTALGGLGQGAIMALGPEMLGTSRRDRLLRAATNIFNSGLTGALGGTSLGAYEAARFREPTDVGYSPTTWLMNYLAKKDRARDQQAAQG